MYCHVHIKLHGQQYRQKESESSDEEISYDTDEYPFFLFR